jgi:DNA-binding Xre family transcriptional regulator
MLTYNLSRIFKSRGINRPTTFFLKLGFSSGTASKYANSKMNSLYLYSIEKICVLLNCTPNDLLEWTPDKAEDDNKNHPLYNLKKSDKATQVNQLIHTLSFSQLEKLEEIIQNIKKDTPSA